MKMLLKTKADIIGFVGTVFFLVGALLLAYRSSWGFTCNVMGNGLFLIQGGMVRLWSIIGVSIALILANLVGIWRWN